jgi:hypothetical protein
MNSRPLSAKHVKARLPNVYSFSFCSKSLEENFFDSYREMHRARSSS